MTVATSRCPACEGVLPSNLRRAGWLRALGLRGLRRPAPPSTRWASPSTTTPSTRGAEYVADQVVPILSGTEAKAFADTTYAPFFREVHPRGDRSCSTWGAARPFPARRQARRLDGERRGAQCRGGRVLRERANLDVVHGHLDAVVATGRKFDVAAFEVLQHLADPLAFVQQARSILHPAASSSSRCRPGPPSVQTATRADAGLPCTSRFSPTPVSQSSCDVPGASAHARGGFIGGDPFPTTLRALQPKWFARRLLRRPREQLGLWGLALG